MAKDIKIGKDKSEIKAFKEERVKAEKAAKAQAAKAQA